jgi:predicted RNase H-like HicB family nuclease
MATHKLTAVITREGDWHVALCPELDIASQGESIESARDDLFEALTLFFEVASSDEFEARLNSGARTFTLDVPHH